MKVGDKDRRTRQNTNLRVSRRIKNTGRRRDNHSGTVSGRVYYGERARGGADGY